MHELDEVTIFIERLNAVAAPYMVTGATAAILYGQPRVTNGLGIVLDLHERHLPAIVLSFPAAEFYLPPSEVIRVEMARTHRGHFNIIHHETGYKADVYLAGDDSLHAWAFARRRSIEWIGASRLQAAPPEYVILRKLEFFREGGAGKHLADIAAILRSTKIDERALGSWVERLGLGELWDRVRQD